MDITQRTIDCSAGQKMNLRGGASDGAIMTTQQWDIQLVGKPIKNYVLEEGKLEGADEIERGDKKLEFYWLKPGTWKVTFTAVINGKSLSTYTYFEVSRPVVSIAVTLGVGYTYQIELPPIATPPTIENPYEADRFVGFGPGPDNPDGGITFKVSFPDGATAAFPAGQADPEGESRLKWVNMSGAKLDIIRPTHLETFLDEVSRSKETLLYRYDSDWKNKGKPTQVLTNWDFCMYLMWKPPGANSIFIPLRKVDWGWSINANQGPLDQFGKPKWSGSVVYHYVTVPGPEDDDAWHLEWNDEQRRQAQERRMALQQHDTNDPPVWTAPPLEP